MTNRRSFIKTSTGVALAFGAGISTSWAVGETISGLSEGCGKKVVAAGSGRFYCEINCSGGNKCKPVCHKDGATTKPDPEEIDGQGYTTFWCPGSEPDEPEED